VVCCHIGAWASGKLPRNISAQGVWPALSSAAAALARVNNFKMDEHQINEALQKGIRAARRGRAEPAQLFLTEVIRADSNNEEAWLWLSRVIDNPLQRAECLQKVLQINPDNRWAAEQLAELQGVASAAAAVEPAEQPSPAEPSSAPGESKYKRLEPQTGEVKLEVLTCPQCGGSVDIQGGAEVKTLVCSYCGSVLDLTSEQAAVIGQANKRLKPTMPIKPGMECTFKDEVHQVIGWIRYEGWDDEDRWRWDEWLLASATGKFRWLSYDSEEGFVLQERISPLAPFDPRRATSIKVPGGTARVTERAPARVLALDGELTWQCKVGDQVAYFEAKRGDARYSVEYTKDEIELFEGQALSDVELWTAFGREDLAEKAKQTAEWNTGYKVLALFCGLLAVVSLCAALTAGLSGQSIAREQVQMSQGEGSHQTIPFEVTQPDKVHRVDLESGGLPVNNWAVVDVAIRSEDGEVYLFGGEFWDEEGRDSDGYWHENDLNANHLFKVEKPGQYFLDLSMEEATVQSVSVTVTVEEGIWLGRYFVIFTVVCAVLAFIFYSLSQRRFVGSSLVQSK
jgi:hypothetical protein